MCYVLCSLHHNPHDGSMHCSCKFCILHVRKGKSVTKKKKKTLKNVLRTIYEPYRIRQQNYDLYYFAAEIGPINLVYSSGSYIIDAIKNPSQFYGHDGSARQTRTYRRVWTYA